jgi:hypothetical protein
LRVVSDLLNPRLTVNRRVGILRIERPGVCLPGKLTRRALKGTRGPPVLQLLPLLRRLVGLLPVVKSWIRRHSVKVSLQTIVLQDLVLKSIVLRCDILPSRILRPVVLRCSALLRSLTQAGVDGGKRSEAGGHTQLHRPPVSFRVLLNALSAIDACHRLLTVESELLNRLLNRLLMIAQIHARLRVHTALPVSLPIERRIRSSTAGSRLETSCLPVW